MVVFNTPETKKNYVFAPQDEELNSPLKHLQTDIKPTWQKSGMSINVTTTRLMTNFNITRRQEKSSVRITFGIEMKAILETAELTTVKVMTHYVDPRPFMKKFLPLVPRFVTQETANRTVKHVMTAMDKMTGSTLIAQRT